MTLYSCCGKQNTLGHLCVFARQSFIAADGDSPPLHSEALASWCRRTRCGVESPSISPLSSRRASHHSDCLFQDPLLSPYRFNILISDDGEVNLVTYDTPRAIVNKGIRSPASDYVRIDGHFHLPPHRISQVGGPRHGAYWVPGAPCPIPW
jgi:hypothetical protein